MDMPGERLRPVIDHLDRTAGVKGKKAEMNVKVEVFPRPERSPDPGRVRPHLVGAKAEAGHHLLLINVDELAGGVEVDAAVSVGYGETCLGAKRSLVLHPDLVMALDHDGSPSLLVSSADLHPPKGRIETIGLLWVDQRGKRLVPNLDQ
jgi:hypothetical protein